jgi:hypothetical protein
MGGLVGTSPASGKCQMSTTRQAADWINAVLYESRVRRPQGRPPSTASLSCERCGARGVPKGRFCANCRAPLMGRRRRRIASTSIDSASYAAAILASNRCAMTAHMSAGLRMI